MIYNSGYELPLPSVDILTLLFDSDYSLAEEDTLLHAEARDPSHGITKSHARSLTTQISYFLRHEYNIGLSGPGKDVVVTISTGQSALACLFYGVVAADGIYSAASTMSTPSDLVRQFRDGPGRLLICSEDMQELVKSAARTLELPEKNILVLRSCPEITLQTMDGSLKCEFNKSLLWRPITEPSELENSVICIIYSSGTTGLPKGVLVSHTNLVSEAVLLALVNRPNYDAWLNDSVGLTKRTIAHLPSAHIAGILGYFVSYFLDGYTVYWMPSFNFTDFLRYAAEFQISHLFTVPPIYTMIAKHAHTSGKFKYMRQAISGAAPMSKDMQRAVSDKFSSTMVVQTWGLTETTGSVTHNPPGHVGAFGSLSPILPNIQLRLVDDNGDDVSPGQAGEALVKGPTVTKGYHNNPEANRETFTVDGWLRTGDILRMENNLLYSIDRKKEMIKYKGMQVAPAELEGLLSTNADISDAAVIGTYIGDTEVPCAYIVLSQKAKGKVTEADIVSYVKARVANHKQLRGGVIFLEAIPRNQSGKILRKNLREMRKAVSQKSSKL